MVFFSLVVGCKNSPDACGSGENGECREPDNPSTDNLYSCHCFDDTFMSGLDCDGMVYCCFYDCVILLL